MSYTKFLEELEETKKDKELLDSVKEDIMKTMNLQRSSLVISRSTWVPMKFNSHNYTILTLDEEDIEYFKTKAKRFLEKEKQEELDKIKEKYDKLNN
jgi:hypothetical protein